MIFQAYKLAILARTTLLGAVLAALPGVQAWAAERIASERHAFTVRTVVSGLEHPWSVAFLPDGRYLISERPGRLRLASASGTLDPEPLAGLPDIAVRGQGGLLDVALDPGFETNRRIYFSYAASGVGGHGTAVARARLGDGRVNDVEVIFRALPRSQGGQHFGSRLLFDPHGHLFITLGDRGDRDRAQDPGDHAGSIIRILPDGTVPADNPFRTSESGRPEIFSIGHRSVQGLALRPAASGEPWQIWAHEHGPQGGDEVNRLVAGGNFGWPVVTYGRNYFTGTRIGEGHEKPGMVSPMYQWTPSIAPSGMVFYSGRRFPGWTGNLFVGALKYQLLARLTIEQGKVVAEERLLTDRLGRIRDVRDGPDGYLYVLTDAANGALYRLEPVP